ncbi:MAG TPA: hypothetical protein VLT84_01085, partial [Acidobacteriota bacterium]|nr:hypothetical protein [Acidobacteriota bacterium]
MTGARPGRSARRALVAATLLAAVLAASATAPAPAAAQPSAPRVPGPVTVPVFRNAALHFLPDSASKFAVRGLTAEENGRVARVTATLPEWSDSRRITALIAIRPEPKSDRDVHDRYDRAGNVRLVIDGGPDLEIARFMTAYGGATEYEVDV